MAAKTSEWRPGPTVCRCCLSEGCYKDISTEYFWMGKREVYSEMLSDTFDLSISYSKSGGPNSASRLICEPCIGRLRDAAEFKRQVQECEKTFVQCLDPVTALADMQVTLELEKEVKVEMVKEEKMRLSDDDDYGAHDYGDDDDDYDDLDDQPLTKLASKIPKKEDVDVLDLLDNAKVTEKRKSSTKVKGQPSKKSKCKQTAGSSKQQKPEPKKKKAQSTEAPTTSKWAMTLAERKNAAVLLQYTTVTPFTYLIYPSSYKCLFCEEKYSELHTLLEHSRKHEIPEHDTILKEILKKGKKRIKVDISILECRVCRESFTSLECIQSHLTHVHEKEFTEAGNGMISFNLKTTNDCFKCHLCLKTFQSFFLINKHMSVHYNNAVCDICGKGFLSYPRLLTHIESHKNGTYPCEKCPKTFPSISKLKYHNAKIHGTLIKMSKCHKCLQRFEHHYEKLKHLKQVHGISFTYTCDICKSTFKARYLLSMHVIKHHTQNIICEICNKTFSEPCQLRKHMPVHTQERKYVCPACKKCYRYERTLKHHLKSKHNPDFKFTCSVCWTGFRDTVHYKIHRATHI
ncbi:zinc finger protein 652 isoform X16 [Bicyclus anynana]|uniref:Zinc finger protein 652 isoform X16 n=1 Tax=Bicyclus anynana TaxID=110368 RepID=A0ABM3M234_BICAN|nr:zinc finger protein 652 isoform X16 [Bicyclus anynana]